PLSEGFEILAECRSERLGPNEPRANNVDAHILIEQAVVHVTTERFHDRLGCGYEIVVLVEMIGPATGKPDEITWVAAEHFFDLSGIFEHRPCTAFDASKQRAQFVVAEVFDD